MGQPPAEQRILEAVEIDLPGTRQRLTFGGRRDAARHPRRLHETRRDHYDQTDGQEDERGGKERARQPEVLDEKVGGLEHRPAGAGIDEKDPPEAGLAKA